MVTGFSKLDSVQWPNRGRVRELIDKKRARRWSRRMRARPLRERPPHRMVASRGGGHGRLREGVLCLALKESFASASSPSRRLPCPMPRCSLCEAEGATVDFELLEMVQATFDAMLLNEGVELGVVHGFTSEGLKSALVGLRWSSFEVWMSGVDHVRREA
ncbi:hypothetical protein Cgig2_020171 [Carnegiea gigantea]|uniref:Uncharacterized protein n=1 Tax=Carnegiea gigantea TaxID=171969 RepID=A0A9Q1KX60_9CARY|nr:hypothetical protein Cgig2_020171 [Carnegiea gigantea]